MPTLDCDGEVGLGWLEVPADEAVPPDGPVLLDLARFQVTSTRGAATGVIIDGNTSHDVLPALVVQASAIAIRFPLFRDGRGFTLLRHLRERLGYCGPILVTGHLLPDQWHHLRELGVSAVLLPEGSDLAPWHRAAARFSRTYQSMIRRTQLQ